MPQNEMNIHGTYPLDSGHWVIKKEIPRDEAAELVEAPKELREMKNPWNKEPSSLFINKGFVVLGMPKKKAVQGIALAFLEQFSNPEVDGIPFGAQAVTLLDGTYYLLRYIGKEGNKAVQLRDECRNKYNHHRLSHCGDGTASNQVKCPERDELWNKFAASQEAVDKMYVKG